jgi:hypothetical protein
MDSSTQKEVNIYMRLLGEGTEVFRPTHALDLGNGIYRLEATPGYDLKTRFGSLPQAPMFEARFGPSSPGSI